jgi:uncharacterized membrane protein
MEAARFNIYYFLTFVTPAVLMLAAGVSRKVVMLFIVAILSVVVTYLLDVKAVDTKWATRIRLARTEEEMEYATADGANLVFTGYVMAPVEAILYTTLWGVVGWKLGARIRRRRLGQGDVAKGAGVDSWLRS